MPRGGPRQGAGRTRKAEEIKNEIVRTGATLAPNITVPKSAADRARLVRAANKMFLTHVELARDELVGILQNPDAKASDKISAAKEILDRAYGKPMQGADLAMVLAKDQEQQKPIITKEQLATLSETELLVLQRVLGRLAPGEE